MFEVLKNKNSRNFLIKFGIFLIFIFAIFPLIKTIMSNFVPVPTITTNFDRNFIYGLFYCGLFLLMIKDELKNIQHTKQNIFESIAFGLLSIFGVFLITMFKSTTVTSSVLTDLELIRLYYIGISLLIIPAILAWLSIFNLKPTKEFIKKFGTKILIVIVLFLLTAIFSVIFQQNWIIFSTFVAKSVNFLLGLTLNSTTRVSSYGTPMLSLEGFEVNIGAPCSGIESASLFIFFYLAIIIFDWKTINKKLAALLWIPGLIGMQIINILRIYTLMLVGHFISPTLAISIFHDNAGWIFFVGYIFLFWYLVYPRIKNKKTELLSN